MATTAYMSQKTARNQALLNKEVAPTFRRNISHFRTESQPQPNRKSTLDPSKNRVETNIENLKEKLA